MRGQAEDPWSQPQFGAHHLLGDRVGGINCGAFLIHMEWLSFA